jgi:hypothetical protein
MAFKDWSRPEVEAGVARPSLSERRSLAQLQFKAQLHFSASPIWGFQRIAARLSGYASEEMHAVYTTMN